MTQLNYTDPKNLCITKMHELIFGIEWFEKKENREVYNKEKNIITNKK
jgi:Fe-S-cluster formation regulator IscX/YfhJ